MPSTRASTRSRLRTSSTVPVKRSRSHSTLPAVADPEAEVREENGAPTAGLSDETEEAKDMNSAKRVKLEDSTTLAEEAGCRLAGEDA